MAGVAACETCGAVLSDEELVHGVPFDPQGGFAGTFVHGGDTGERPRPGWDGAARIMLLH